MHLLVLQHHPAEHPGEFRRLLQEDGHSVTTVQLDQAETLPVHFDFDGLWVMGGPMDVWEEKRHPWLIDEKAYIKEAVEKRGMSYLGLCLGHQLLAEALGGSVGSGQPEIGVCSAMLTETGAEGIFMDGLPEHIDCLQWHSAEIKTLPPGGQCLATSEACAVQALQWGPRAYSVQFHLEVEADTVDVWANIPEYRAALEQALGADGVQSLTEACAAQLLNFNTMAERLYINWMQTTARVG